MQCWYQHYGCAVPLAGLSTHTVPFSMKVAQGILSVYTVTAALSPLILTA